MIDRRNLLAAAAALPLAAEAAVPRHAPRHSTLLGAWSLVDAITVEQDGKTGPWEGKPKPYTGLITYMPTGLMAVQIANARTALSHDVDFAQLPAEQRLAYLDNYYAYFAKWTFNAATSIITHHVVSSLDPSEIGIDYHRKVKLSGNSLTLTTLNNPNSSRKSHNVLSWRRT